MDALAPLIVLALFVVLPLAAPAFLIWGLKSAATRLEPAFRWRWFWRVQVAFWILLIGFDLGSMSEGGREQWLQIALGAFFVFNGWYQLSRLGDPKNVNSARRT